MVAAVFFVFLCRLVGFLVSTVVITLFGEILPQAICARHGLKVGGNLAFFVWGLEWVLYPVVKPIATALNFLLGEAPTGNAMVVRHCLLTERMPKETQQWRGRCVACTCFSCCSCFCSFSCSLSRVLESSLFCILFHNTMCTIS